MEQKSPKKDRFFPADINGDGKIDVVHIAFHPGGQADDPPSWPHAAIDIAVSQGDGTFTFTGEHNGAPWDDEDVWFPGDFNADGKSDLVHAFRKPADSTTTFDHGGFGVALSDGSGSRFDWRLFNTTFPWYRPAPPGNNNKYPTPWLVGDIDGDRRTDLVNLSDATKGGIPTQTMAVAFAREGDRFEFAPSFNTDVQPSGWPWETPESVPVHLADLNGDGKQDLLLTPWRRPGFNYPLELLGHLSPNRGLDLFNWQPADVSGDGRQDLIYSYFRNPGYSIFTLLNRGDGTYARVEDTVDLPNLPGATGPLDDADTTAWMATDIGGGPSGAPDGKADMVRVDHVPDRRLTVTSMISNGDGKWRRRSQTFLLSFGSDFPAGYVARRWRPMDVNGDGRTDLVHVYHDHSSAYIQTLLAKGDGTWSPTTSVFFHGLAAGDGPNWQPADVNDDGRVDLVLVSLEPSQPSQTRVRTLLADGDGTWTPVDDMPAAAPAFLDTRNWTAAEVNGDGMADLEYVEYLNPGIRLHLLLSKGNGRWAAERTPAFAVPPGIQHADVRAFRRADVNADGKTDLVHVSTHLSPAGSLRTAVILVTNRYPEWTVQTQPEIPFQFADSPSWQTMDGDGDGRTELTYVHSDLQRLAWPAAADRTDRVVSELGGTTTVDYQPSSAWDANQAGSGCHLPLGVVTYAVKGVGVADGRAATPARVSRAYSCARWSYRERGLLGWEEVYEFRPAAVNQDEATILNRYSLTDECLAQPTYMQAHDSDGKPFSKTIISYLPPGPAPPYRCLVNDRNEILLNQRADGPNALTSFAYDEFGNVTFIHEHGNPLVADDDRNTSRRYQVATGPYIVGLPAGEEVQEGPDSSGKVLRARIFCYDGDATLTCLNPPSRGLLTASKELNSNGLAGLAVTDLFYDRFGNLAGIRDPNRHGRTLVYDPKFHVYPTATCNALSQCRELTWDPVSGRARSVADLNGQHARFTYDALGRLKSAAFPGGGKLRRDYLDWGDPTRQRIHERLTDGSADGLWQEVYLDGLGREYLHVQEGDRAGVTFRQDRVFTGASDLVHLQSHWYASGGTPTYEAFAYDGLGRPTRQAHPDGTALRWERSSDTRTSSVTAVDELGHARSAYADAFGRTVRLHESVGGQPADAQFTYTAADEPRTIVDPAGNTTTFDWDWRGRKTSVTDPDRGTWTYTYDLAGNVLTHTDARKLTVRFTYDALNRVTTKQDPDGRLLTWRYDEPGHPGGLGRLTSVTDSVEGSCPGQQTDWFGYDDQGHATTARQCVAGTTAEVSSSYDRLGRSKSLTYPDGQTVTYEYDMAGRLHRMPGYVDAMTYDAAGRLATADYANGTHAAYDGDRDRGWLNKATVNSQAGTLYEATYQHFANGAVRSTRSPTNQMNLDYSYDERIEIAGPRS